MLFFGIGELLKLVVLVKAVMVPVTLHTLVGVRDAQPKLREAAAVLRLPPRLLVWRLLLPAALPAFLRRAPGPGARLDLAAGGGAAGLQRRHRLPDGLGRQLFMLDLVFVCILVVGLIGAAMDRGIQAVGGAWCTGRSRPPAKFRRAAAGVAGNACNPGRCRWPCWRLAGAASRLQWVDRRFSPARRRYSTPPRRAAGLLDGS
jgi:sulfonate transport system permease protein